MINNFKPQLTLNVEGLINSLSVGMDNEFINPIISFVENDLYKTVEHKFMDLETRQAMSSHIRFQIAINWEIIADDLIKEDKLNAETIKAFIFALTYAPVSLNIFNSEENKSLNAEIIERFNDKLTKFYV